MENAPGRMHPANGSRRRTTMFAIHRVHRGHNVFNDDVNLVCRPSVLFVAGWDRCVSMVDVAVPKVG